LSFEENRGQAYVTGSTDSTNFPVTPGAFQTENLNGGLKAFVAKLGADGAGLAYSTYFGGSNGDRVNAIAVDAHGNAYVAGETYSYDLPVTPGALQPDNAGGFFDGFVLKLNPAGTSAPYVTYLGGSDWDSAQGVAVGPDGGIHLTGFTYSYDFNVTPFAFQPNRGDGGSDAFVTKLRLDATHYSVTGRVTNQFGVGLAGAEVAVSGGFQASEFTDEDGYYTLPGIPVDSEVMLLAIRFGFTFTPQTVVLRNVTGDVSVSFSGQAPLRISGRILDEFGGGIPTQVTLTSATGDTNFFTGWDGFYYFIVPRGSDYTVTPSHPLYTFEPPSRSVTNALADQIFTFEALPPLSIRGSMTDEEGNRVAGATVTLAGAVNATATTDEFGVYGFNNLPRGGSYTVTPAHGLYNFEPASLEFPNMAGDQTAPFNGTFRRFTLSGRAADSNGAVLSGVEVRLGGGYADLKQTDADGNYSFANLRVGRNYTVTAARPGYAFAPATHNVNDPRADRSANFTGSHLTYAINGRVTDSAGAAGISGATVSLSGSLSATTQTDAQGDYSFAGLPSEGSYNVSASHPSFSCTPATRAFNNLLDNMESDFAGTRRRHQIGGRVSDGAGAALSGVTVTLGGASTATAQTDSFGLYLFADLASGFD
jgi:hypothetical protein